MDPPDTPIPPVPIELKPVNYSIVVHNQPHEQQYSTIGPSNPLMNTVHDVHAKSDQSFHS